MRERIRHRLPEENGARKICGLPLAHQNVCCSVTIIEGQQSSDAILFAVPCAMTRIRTETLSDLIGGFYDAAYGASTWQDALSRLAGAFHGSRAWLFANEANGSKIYARTSMDDPGFYSPEAQLAIVADPLTALTHANPQGAIVRHSEMEPLSDFRKRGLFRDWLQPRDIWFSLQAHMKADERSRIFVEVDRGSQQGDFTDPEKELLSTIAPHILRAVTIAAAMADQRVTSIAATSGVAAMVVNSAAQVIEMNSAADALFHEPGIGVSMTGGALSVDDNTASERWQGLLADALSPLGATGGGAVIVNGSKQRVVVSVSPIPQTEFFSLRPEPLALVLLRPLRTIDEGPLMDALRQLFGLPPSQSALAVALASGCSLQQAAAERGLSYATCRTYVERIYRKTGTSHQGELVALIKAVEATL